MRDGPEPADSDPAVIPDYVNADVDQLVLNSLDTNMFGAVRVASV